MKTVMDLLSHEDCEEPQMAQQARASHHEVTGITILFLSEYNMNINIYIHICTIYIYVQYLYIYKTIYMLHIIRHTHVPSIHVCSEPCSNGFHRQL